ncbi:MAG: CBS domain-containing protein, partial [Microcystaceae cyanobacterium]
LLNLAELMSEYRVSCIVITETNAEHYHVPIGIVTERDIVQFQSLALDFATTQALSVMSSPLFCLSPDSSLWTAHQEMQKLRVRRLAVSDAQGHLVGIITQTSLLRAIDPTELYSVIQVLQQKINQLQSANLELLQNRNLELEKQVQQRAEQLQQQETALQRERDFANAVVDTVDSLVVVLDPQGTIVRFNQACETVTHYSLTEVQGKCFQELFLLPEEVASFKSVFEQSDTPSLAHPSEMYWLTKAGECRLIAWSDMALFDPTGAVEYIIVTGIDITEREQAEANLKQLNQELENRVEQGVTHLRNLNQELLQQSQDLANFSSNLKKLHRINTKNYQTCEELFTDYLQTGCEIFGLSTGIIGEIKHQTYIIRSVQSDIDDLKAGLTFKLEQTYCAAVAKEQTTMTYLQIGTIESLCNHPLYEKFRLETYIGTPIFVNEQIYGTLSFLSPQSKQTQFELYEREIIELMAESIGRFIAAHQAKIKRQQAEEAFWTSQR